MNETDVFSAVWKKLVMSSLSVPQRNECLCVLHVCVCVCVSMLPPLVLNTYRLYEIKEIADVHVREAVVYKIT